MERFTIGEPLTIQESLRDDREFFPYFVTMYEQMFQYLKKFHSVNANHILTGATGFGADALGAGRTFPNAHITAVSLADFPENDTTSELAERLTVVEATIETHLRYAVKHGQQFDLVVFCNAPVKELSDPSTPFLLNALTMSGGHILNYVQGGAVLPLTSMDILFRRISLPRHQREVYDCLFWEKR